VISMTKMTNKTVRKLSLSLLPVVVASASWTALAAAQEGDGIRTQTLLRVDSKQQSVPTIPTTSLMVNNKPAPITSLVPVSPNGTQIAILIDDGLRRSAALQLDDIRKFITSLPAGTQVMVGYMANGGVQASEGFTTDHAAAAATLRIPFGVPGLSASPYFCLSEFVKHWPGNDMAQEQGPATGTMARFVLMISDGVDPYNGSTRLANQDSPYVQTAVDDANRAGVAVSSIYYGDAGIHGGSANFSGQSYLGNPVSFQPFLKQFATAISETYIATFPADPKNEGREQLVRLKVNTSLPKTKLRHADEVRPGNHEAGPQG
jgi:hypothetical protein